MKFLIKKILIRVFMWGMFLISLGMLNTVLTSTYAYASTQNDVPYLKNIYLDQGDSIDFEKDKYDYIVDVDEDVDEIIIKPKPDNSDYALEINDETLSRDEKYKYTSKLVKGKNVFEIRVTNDKNDLYSVYKVFVYRGGEKAVYLKNLTLNDWNFGFNKTDSFYNIELDEGTEEAVIKAETFDDHYTVSVQNTVLNSSNTVKLRFKEKAGKYSFVVKVKDDETERTGEYVINIYLGIPVSPNIGDSLNQVLKPNQWVIVNGRWQYNDLLGRPVKNNWLYDSKYDGYFHFNSRGNMQTGWVIIDNCTYYLGNDGKMQTGWVEYEGKWYYLNSDGKMQTGWTLINDKWYYFNNFGSMQTGWINLNDKWYFLSSSGYMKTGWILYDKKWYYLNLDGEMQTGWLYYYNEWYYLNNNGDMKSGEWLHYNNNWYYINYSGTMRCGWLYRYEKYYYMDENGKMVTGTQIIDGYTYSFGTNGEALL